MAGAVGVGGRGFVRLDRWPFGLGGRPDGWRTAGATADEYGDGFGGLGGLEEAGGGMGLVSRGFLLLLLLFPRKCGFDL